MADGSRFNVEDPRFGSRREPASPPTAYQPSTAEWSPETPKKKRSLLASCFIGCLITAVMLVAVIAIGVWWVWRDVASTVGAAGLKAFIDSTDLPAGEKDDIHLEIDRLADAFRDGEISAEQMRFIFDSIETSPLLTTLAASAIGGNYLAASNLNEEEKAEGRQTLGRFIRGIIDGKINEAALDQVMRHVADPQEGGGWQLRNRVTDEQLRDFLAEAKQQADLADIPAEPEDIDPSEEFKRIIDEAMQAR